MPQRGQSNRAGVAVFQSWQGVHSRQQFTEIKRFHHVIVSPRAVGDEFYREAVFLQPFFHGRGHFGLVFDIKR